MPPEDGKIHNLERRKERESLSPGSTLKESSIEGLPDSGATEGLPDSGETEGLPDSGATEGLPDSGETEGLPDSGETEGLKARILPDLLLHLLPVTSLPVSSQCNDILPSSVKTHLVVAGPKQNY
ncbi:hypothetical protein EOD39_5361 [Acipenser ruthenus]|uniref:Uncharacterized protein n=1 Tax=Acipenser ruthenus TaxID=7906 RepID=A0A444TW26_ACIRT|nr:hypothetical protein EOD39_5361 [Acipenser ruthenus]